MKPQVLVLAGALTVVCPATATAASSQVPLVEVGGSVTYSGVIPPPVDVPDAGKTRALIEVDARTHGLKGAVVWLEGVPGPADAHGAKDAPVVMGQEDFSFVPHVVAVRAGGSVEFRNGDPPNHAVQANAAEPTNAFNFVTPPGGRVVRRFRSAKRPIAITCPIHAGMAAWVYVFDHPYFAVTDTSGTFRLPAAPPGKYKLKVQHLDGHLDASETVTVAAPGPARVSVDLHEHSAGPSKVPPESRKEIE